MPPTALCNVAMYVNIPRFYIIKESFFTSVCLHILLKAVIHRGKHKDEMQGNDVGKDERFYCMCQQACVSVLHLCILSVTF